jgi:cytochrome c
MSFEANKIAGAILAAMILAMVSGIISNILVRPAKLETPAYAIAGGEAAPAAATSTAPAGPEPIAPLLASANADAGKDKAKLCITCHSFDKGGPNKIGPNLYGVVGDEIAHDRGGFAFSEVLKAKGGTWTADNLNRWLWKPQSFARGTKMTFIGLAKAEDRANVVAYLNSLSDNPKPLASLAQEAASAETPAQPAGNAAAAPPGGAAPAAAKGNAPAKP